MEGRGGVLGGCGVERRLGVLGFGLLWTRAFGIFRDLVHLLALLPTSENVPRSSRGAGGAC